MSFIKQGEELHCFQERFVSLAYLECKLFGVGTISYHVYVTYHNGTLVLVVASWHYYNTNNE